MPEYTIVPSPSDYSSDNAFCLMDGKITLGSFPTMKEAILCKGQWILRDNLLLDLENFIDTLISRYGSLSPDEIRLMIKEY